MLESVKNQKVYGSFLKKSVYFPCPGRRTKAILTVLSGQKAAAQEQPAVGSERKLNVCLR